MFEDSTEEVLKPSLALRGQLAAQTKTDEFLAANAHPKRVRGSDRSELIRPWALDPSREKRKRHAPVDSQTKIEERTSNLARMQLDEEILVPHPRAAGPLWDMELRWLQLQTRL